MKNIRRVILLLLVGVAVYFYRSDMGDHWIRHWYTSRSGSFETEMNLARDARLSGDFSLSLQILQRLERSLAGQEEPLEKERLRRRALHRQIVCESAAVYKALAMKYLGESNVTLYQENIQLAGEQLQACAAESL